MVFMVENEPIHANTDILCEKSEYFQAMFRSKMRESLERVVEVTPRVRAMKKSGWKRIMGREKTKDQSTYPGVDSMHACASTIKAAGMYTLCKVKN